MLHTPLPQTPLPSALGGLPHRRQQLQFTGIELATTEPAEASTTQAPTVPIPPEPLSATSAPTRVSPLEAQAQKQQRTKGQYVFDAFLYPFLTNFAVFAFSVYVTHQSNFGPQETVLTKRGDACVKFAQEKLKFSEDKAKAAVLILSSFLDGSFLRKRGDACVKFAQEKLKFSEASAKAAVMVMWSFLDGCLMAPVVKLFEDRRNDIAQKIDKKLGTEPDDPDAYKQEPKQTWGSVLGGRFVTAGIVVPTATVLSKVKVGQDKKNSLNDVLFYNPGHKAGEWVEKNLPPVKKLFPPGFDIAGLFKTMAFEAFYTSVCTAGLYVSSRLFATLAQKFNEKKEAPLKEGATVAKQPSTPTPATVTTGLTPA
ncbi:MAG: hypothetical protein ACKO34_05535 [Vampirovibrionales bacterium]